MKQYKEYKDSGVKWIGKIPSHWEVKTLRAFIRLYSEKNHAEKQLLSVTREQGVILRNIKSKEDNHNYIPDDLSGYKMVRKGDFVINKMKSWQGSYGVSNNEGIVSPAYYVCKLEFENKDFFSKSIRSKVYVPFFNQYSKGIRVDQWDLSPIALKSIPFFEPPLSEQNEIVAYLDNKVSKIDKYIATAEKKIAALDELKQVTIADAVTHGINPNVPMKDSGIPWIGMVPEHWEVNKIRSLFKLSNQKTSDPNCTLLSLSQYTGVRLKSECANVGMFEAETTIGYNIVQKGQFIMNIMLAWNGSYSVSNYNGVISPAYCVFDFIRNCDKKYFDYLLRLKAYSGAFKTLSKGLIDSRLRLYPDYFKTFPIVIPPVEEQNEIVAYIDRKVAQIDKMKAAELAQIDKLKEYKQRLISDVVTGKVKVTNE